MANKIWLVNDQLGTLQERTFWHDLLDLGLEDRTGGYTPYDQLADKIEREARIEKPDLIVRNATYFRHLNVDCPQICFVQDICTNARLRDMQEQVIQKCDVAVYNSQYTLAHAPQSGQHRVIPIGVDFDLFQPLHYMREAAMRDRYDLPVNTVLWVGSSAKVKGWNFLQQLVEETNFHFCVVTKDGARIEHPRVKCFGPVDQQTLADIMNACKCLVCTSLTETQHLAGIEAAACDLPLVVPNIGIYYDAEPLDGSGCVWTDWGAVAIQQDVETYKKCIQETFDNPAAIGLCPRQHFLDLGCDKATSMTRWKELIDEVLNLDTYVAE